MSTLVKGLFAKRFLATAATTSTKAVHEQATFPSAVLCRLEEYYDTVLAEDLLALSYDHNLANPSSIYRKDIDHLNKEHNHGFREYQRLKLKERELIAKEAAGKEKKSRSERLANFDPSKKSSINAVNAPSKPIETSEAYKKFLDPPALSQEELEAMPNAYERLPRLIGINLKMVMPKAATHSKKVLLNGMLAMQLVTGQHASLYRAESANVQLRIREGFPIGVQAKITDTRAMYNFLEKFVEIVLPKLRDFRGFTQSIGDGTGKRLKIELDSEAWDSFPEIELAYLKFAQRGSPAALQKFEIEFVTNAANDEDARLLLSGFKLPLTFRDPVTVVEEEVKIDNVHDV